MRGRPATILLAITVTVLSLLAPAAQAQRPARAHATRTTRAAQAQRPARTAVTVVLRDCAGCRVQAVHYVPATGADPWWSHWRTVDSDQQVVFDVPRARTHGLTFFVDAPWAGNPGAASMLTARYPHQAVGSRVSRHKARHSKRAEVCWAGTQRPTARLVYRVERARGRELSTGERIEFPRAYAVRTLPAWPPMEPAYKGSAQAQDAVGCVNPSDRPVPRPHRATPRTVLTLRARGCEGCTVRLEQWRRADVPPWISAPRPVRHGRVGFRVPTARTHGMLVGVTGPWEAADAVPTGFQSLAVFRYAGQRPGSRVGFASARHQHRGSACWAGTSARRATLRLGVREVTVRATSGEDTQGTLAWLPVQRASWRPMRRVAKGVYGTEQSVVCRPR